MTKKSLLRLLMIFAVLLMAASMSLVLAKKKPPKNCPTPRPDCICPLIYAPVVCDGGCTYSNACFANCAGATNCQPSGG